MKLLKLTAYFSLFFVILMTTSCEREAELRKANFFSKDELPMTGAQERPIISSSTATGTLSVSYDKRVKYLNYKISWTGLTGAPASIGIYGPVPEGYAALTAVGGLASPIWNIPVTGLTATGSISGSVLVEEAAVKEQTLLNHLYYVNIRTSAWPAGEIRSQIKFE
jgi:hypothetical protein